MSTRPRARRIRLSFHAVLAAGLVAVLAGTTLPGISGAVSPADDAPFSRLTGFEPTGADVRIRPSAYAASRVDRAALSAALPAAGGSAVVSLPDPRGRLQRFRVQPTTLMESELAAAHPEIRTFAGRGLDDPRATVALDLTPMGFHASVRGPAGQRAW